MSVDRRIGLYPKLSPREGASHIFYYPVIGNRDIGSFEVSIFPNRDSRGKGKSAEIKVFEYGRDFNGLRLQLSPQFSLDGDLIGLNVCEGYFKSGRKLRKIYYRVDEENPDSADVWMRSTIDDKDQDGRLIQHVMDARVVSVVDLGELNVSGLPERINWVETVAEYWTGIVNSDPDERESEYPKPLTGNILAKRRAHPLYLPLR